MQSFTLRAIKHLRKFTIFRVTGAVARSCNVPVYVVMAAFTVFPVTTGRADCTINGGGGGGGAVGCQVQYQTVYANLIKCGFEEYSHPDLPRVHMYLEQDTSESYSYSTSSSESNTNPVGSDTACGTVTYGVGSSSSYFLQEFTYTFSEYITPSTCDYSNLCTGSYNLSEIDNDNRTCYTICDDCSTFYDGSTFSETISGASPQICGVGCSGSTGWCFTGTESLTEGQGAGYTTCPDEDTGGSTNTTTSDFTSCIFTRGYEVVDGPQNAHSDFSADGVTDTMTFSLANENTDQMLYDNIVSLMGPYPSDPTDWFTPDASGGDFYQTTAYSMIDGDHVYGVYQPSEQPEPELQKMRVRIAIPDSQIFTSYLVSWDFVTYDFSTGTLVGTVHKQTTVSGNGTTAYSTSYEAPAPFWESDDTTIYGGVVATFVMNVNASISSSVWTIPPGSGPGPLFNAKTGALSGCSSCGAAGSLYQNISPFGGITATFSMGAGLSNASAGSLAITGSSASTNLATPFGLSYPDNMPNVTVIQAGTAIRQLNAPQAFVDVVTDNAFQYELRYYLPSQVGGISGGLYTLSGSPYVTWTVANPDSSLSVYNQLQVTETRDSVSSVYNYTYNATTGSWTLDYPGSLREDEVSTGVTTNTSGATLNVTNEIRVPGGPDQYKAVRYYHNQNAVPGYGGVSFYLTQETLNPDSNPQTTTYTYYPYISHFADATVLPIKTITQPNGRWQYFYYESDGSGNLDEVDESFADAPFPTGTPDTSTCRRIIYDYYGLTDDDAVTNYLNVPRTTLEYVSNNAVSVTYVVITPSQRQDIRAHYNWSEYSDSDNLVTTTAYYTSGANDGKISSIQNPDGTMSIYAYGTASDFTQTNIVWTGAPNGGGTAIVDGTETVTIVSPIGQMISRTVTNIVSGITLANDVYGNYDGLGRPQLVTHLDGTTEQTYYACCGVDNTVDRDGVTTQYYYDVAHRQDSYIKNGILFTNILDSVGHTIASIRIGTDNSQVVLGQWQYDDSGTLITATNALNGVTTYVQSSDLTTGGLIRTTTNPDATTIVEAYYLDGTLKERTGTGVHGSVFGSGYDGTHGLYSGELKLNPNGTATSEGVTNYLDFLGRNYRTAYSDGSYSQTFYNTPGQLSEQIDPDGVITLYQYNGKGEMSYTAVDINQNGSIDFSGVDQITLVTNDVTTDYGYNVVRSRTYVWNTPYANSSVLTSMSETSTDGLNSWRTAYRDASTPVTTHTQTVYGSGGSRTVTITAPDGSYTVSAYSYGILSSVTRYNSSSAQIGKTSYSYDPHGRQSAVSDARNGATSYSYNNADIVTSVTMPNSGALGDTAQTMLTSYDKMLRATNVVYPDNTSVATRYQPTGEVALTYGSRTYPVGYSYDYAGRMKTMTNWSNFATGAGSRVTTWNYDAYRGFLTSKADAVGNAVSYTYTGAGRLASRGWARGTNTTYSYNTAGSLSGVSYSDSTPGVTYTYDRMGRKSSVLCNSTTTSYSYDFANDLLSESYSGGILNGLSMTNGYDTLLRRTNLTALGSAFTSTTVYGYDNASRLALVSDGTDTATYTYLANSPLVGQITYAQSGTMRMTTTKQYDYLNRLSSISSTPSNSFGYLYNAANQRTMNRQADGSYWRYGYDSLGQVIAGNKFWVDETPVAGQEFDYAFDTIGNRTQTEAGGDQMGLNLRVASYTNNSLNQITSRDYPGYVDVMGDGLATNAVTVNSVTAYRKNEYFRQQVSVANTSSPVWEDVTVAAPGQTSVTGYAYVPKTPENYTYDLDGNLLSDGRWNYTWDGENRLVSMTSLSGAPSGSQLQLNFTYDYQGQRIQKAVAAWSGSAYTNAYTYNYLYDGWNCIGTLDPSLNLLSSFMWGLDLSGSMQSAGGVGGLIREAYYGASTTNCFMAFDGNGNVSALVNAADGTTVANYEYGPFLESIRATGLMAPINFVTGSSKIWDRETDLLYYGHRYYNPSTGRWLSRDPAEEDGGNDLYAISQNDVIDKYDFLGLCGPLCGCDVTTPVINTWADINNTFSGWSLVTRWRSCKALLSPAHNWDIEELKIGAKTQGCARTVMFNGSCYYRSAVNYSMYGRACALCNAQFSGSSDLSPWSQQAAVAYVLYYKLRYAPGGLNGEALQAIPFVIAGYQMASPRSIFSVTTCPSNPQSASDTLFHWHWKPGKPYAGAYELHCPSPASQ
jgi:RHS repeat-associated protein